MKKVLLLFIVFILGAGLYGQKITELTEATTAPTTSLMYIRQGASGNLVKKITVANLLKNTTLTGTTTIASLTLVATPITATGANINNTAGSTGNFQTQINSKEDSLGRPASTGFVLSSTTTGVRSWVENGGTVDTNYLSNRIDARTYFNYDYYIQNVSGTYYARPSPNTSLTAYSGAGASAVINAAIIELDGAGGGIIHTKAGTYTITDAVLFEDVSDIHLIGEGKDNTIFTSAGVGTLYTVIDFRGTNTNIEIAGIKAISTATNATEQQEALVTMQYHDTDVHDPILENVWIHDNEFTNPAVNMNAWYSTLYEENSTITNLRIERNYIHDVGRCGIETYSENQAATKQNEVYILDNEIENTGLSGDHGMGVSVVGSNSYVKIDRNRIIDHKVNQAIELMNCDYCSVSDNFVYNITDHVTGITLSGSPAFNYPCNYVTVANNIITLNDPDAPGTTDTWSMPFNFGGSNFVTITGNKLRGNHSDFESIKYSTISDNIYNCLSPYGFNLTDATQYVKVHDNLMYGDSATYDGAVFRCYGADNAYNEFIDNKFKFPAWSSLFISSTNAHDNICEFVQGVDIYTASDGATPSVPPGNNYLRITSDNAAYYINLPAASATLVGKIIRGHVGDNGFEIRVNSAQLTSVYLNDVTTNVEAAIPANTNFTCELVDATHWILKTYDHHGTAQTTIVPDAI